MYSKMQKAYPIEDLDLFTCLTGDKGLEDIDILFSQSFFNFVHILFLLALMFLGFVRNLRLQHGQCNLLQLINTSHSVHLLRPLR
jgi:hypothetical protein